VQRRRDLYLASSMAAVAMLGVVLANSMGSFRSGRRGRGLSNWPGRWRSSCR
jgi:hypothetical protein